MIVFNLLYWRPTRWILLTPQIYDFPIISGGMEK